MVEISGQIVPGLPVGEQDSIVVAKKAVEKIAADAENLNRSEEHVLFLMAVSTTTGKAIMLPAPTKQNITKLMTKFDELPEKIQTAVLSTIPADDVIAATQIWAGLLNKPESELCDELPRAFQVVRGCPLPDLAPRPDRGGNLIS